jgi:hypothetical protein
VIVHNAAVGSIEGHLNLHVPIINGTPLPTRASFTPTEFDNLQLQVPVVTLDSIDLRCVSFIKIDVEGYEMDVLRGASRLLDQYHPILLIEIDRSRHTENSFSAVIGLLSAKGYLCHIARAGMIAQCDRPWDAPSAVYNFIFTARAFASSC